MSSKMLAEGGSVLELGAGGVAWTVSVSECAPLACDLAVVAHMVAARFEECQFGRAIHCHMWAAAFGGTFLLDVPLVIDDGADQDNGVTLEDGQSGAGNGYTVSILTDNSQETRLIGHRWNEVKGVNVCGGFAMMLLPHEQCNQGHSHHKRYDIKFN